MHRFDEYMACEDTWYVRKYGDVLTGPIAYLCAEYGVHPSNPGYSGGLGVLAGDHAKSASDLGLPFMGTGLLYRRGYFRQHLDIDGTQQHHYPIVDVSRFPVRPVQAPSGGQLTVQVEFPRRTVDVAVWSFNVGARADTPDGYRHRLERSRGSPYHPHVVCAWTRNAVLPGTRLGYGIGAGH